MKSPPTKQETSLKQKKVKDKMANQTEKEKETANEAINKTVKKNTNRNRKTKNNKIDAVKALTNKPIGILGGTFDPVHNGHIKMATEVLKKLNLAEIRFIPCRKPVHRPPTVASAKHRLAMLNLALSKYKTLNVDDREIKRKSPSYMIDTLISLRNDFPNNPLCLILGADAFAKISSWHRFKELLKYAHFVVINRPDLCAEESLVKNDKAVLELLKNHQTTDKKSLFNLPNGKIYSLNLPSISISATAIRKQLAEYQRKDLTEYSNKYFKKNNHKHPKNNKQLIKNNLQSLLPNEVWQYVRDHREVYLCNHCQCL